MKRKQHIPRKKKYYDSDEDEQSDEDDYSDEDEEYSDDIKQTRRLFADDEDLSDDYDEELYELDDYDPINNNNKQPNKPVAYETLGIIIDFLSWINCCEENCNPFSQLYNHARNDWKGHRDLRIKFSKDKGSRIYTFKSWRLVEEHMLRKINALIKEYEKKQVQINKSLKVTNQRDKMYNRFMDDYNKNMYNIKRLENVKRIIMRTMTSPTEYEEQQEISYIKQRSQSPKRNDDRPLPHQYRSPKRVTFRDEDDIQPAPPAPTRKRVYEQVEKEENETENNNTDIPPLFDDLNEYAVYQFNPNAMNNNNNNNEKNKQDF